MSAARGKKVVPTETICSVYAKENEDWIKALMDREKEGSDHSPLLKINHIGILNDKAYNDVRDRPRTRTAVICKQMRKATSKQLLELTELIEEVAPDLHAHALQDFRHDLQHPPSDDTYKKTPEQQQLSQRKLIVLRNRLDRQNEAVEVKQREIQKLREKLLDQEMKQKGSSSETHEQTMRLLDDERKRNKELTKQLSNESDQNKKYQKETEDLRNKLKKKEDEFNEVLGELESTRKELSETQAELADTKEKLSVTEKRLEKVEENDRKTQGQIASLFMLRAKDEQEQHRMSIVMCTSSERYNIFQAKSLPFADQPCRTRTLSGKSSLQSIKDEWESPKTDK